MSFTGNQSKEFAKDRERDRLARASRGGVAAGAMVFGTLFLLLHWIGLAAGWWR